jgi:hypothetical protein
MGDIFGIPARTPVQDANEGGMNLVRHTPPQAQLRSGPLLTRPDVGAQRAGQILQIAETGIAETKEASDLKKADAATIRQGQSEAINEFDKENKRTGIAKYLFGEDAGYETAQRIAVQNGANADYLTMATSVQEDAYLSAEEYAEKLFSVRNERLALYEGDTEAQAAVLREWLPQQSNLIREQALRHKTLGLEMAHAEKVKGYEQQFDTFQVEMQDSASSTGQAKAKQEYLNLFSVNTKDPLATQEATKLMKLEALNRSIAKGNILPYTVMMEETQFYNSLTPLQRDTVTKAIAQNDKVRTGEMAEIESLAVSAILEGDVAGYTTGLKKLADMQPQLSGTTEVTTNWNESRNRMLAGMAKLEANAAKANAAIEETAGDIQAFASGDNATITGRQMTAKRLNAAADSYTVLLATSMNPDWDTQSVITEEDAARYYLKNEPTVVNGRNVRPMATLGKALEARGAVATPMIESMTSLAISGFGLGSEQGVMHPTKKQELQSVIELANTAPLTFKASVGADAYAELKIIERGMGGDVQSIQQDINAYRQNKSQVGSLTPAMMGLGTGMTKYDYVKQLVQGHQKGVAPDDRTMQHYMEEYDRGFLIHQSKQGADEYIRISALDRNTQFKGSVIPNGKFLSDAIARGSGNGETLESTLDTLDGTPVMAALISTRISVNQQAGGVQVSKLLDIPGVSFKANLSNNSLEVNSPAFAYPLILDQNLLMSAMKTAESKRVLKTKQLEAEHLKAFQNTLNLSGKPKE